jgi:hypothetical protein
MLRDAILQVAQLAPAAVLEQLALELLMRANPLPKKNSNGKEVQQRSVFPKNLNTERMHMSILPSTQLTPAALHFPRSPFSKLLM